MHAQPIELKTQNPTDRIALRGVRIRSVLRAMSQRTLVEQTFVNQERQAVEAIYTFPLPDGAAVCGFEVVTGDRVITARVEESEQAIAMYEKAINAGDGAFTLEQVRPDVFTVRVGNLRPQQAATVRLTYVKELEAVDRVIRLTLPTTIAPRYISAAGMDPLEAMIDGDALNPPHVLDVPYGLRLEMEIDLGVTLKSVTCSSHSIRTESRSPKHCLVTFAGSIEEMNRDVVLQLDLGKHEEPSVQRGTGPGRDQFVALTFVPDFPAQDLREPEAAETVFLIDCSGSMGGRSIEQAKLALELCLRSLNRGDTFNICRFGSNHEFLSPEPIVYAEQTMRDAVAYVRSIQADLGGTEVSGPLNGILVGSPQVGSVRQVILLTDGQVSNEPAIVALAKRHRATNRIFTFGIGPACSTHLINGLAKVSGGASEFVTEGERIDEKVLRTFGRMASPLVSDAAVEWERGAGTVTQYPSTIPALFDGDAVTVFARVNGDLPSQVSLRCRTPQGPRSWILSLPTMASEDNGLVASIWARRALAEGESSGWNRAELMALSKEFGVLCQATTFLAVEHRSVEDRNNGRPELRRVPILLPQDYPMSAGMAAPMGARCAAPISCVADSVNDASLGKYVGAIGGMPAAPSPGRTMKKAGFFAGLRRQKSEAASGAPSQAEPVELLPALLATQSADGWFAISSSLESSLKREAAGFNELRKQIAKQLSQIGGSGAPHVLDSLVVLAVLHRQFAKDRALWKRAADKAIRWMVKECRLTSAAVDSILASVGRVKT